ncbi:MAG: efflux RND transporter permease subunit [Verrucomicrobiales bacterium]|nr:efflux RND transporter permease subunit [Verrucomicrobiota bacterium JB025]
MNQERTPEARGLAGRLAAMFAESKLTPLIVIASVLLGVFALVKLPREEEPQIKAPMIDVMVSMPGASAREIEERVTRPMEQLLHEISGVEYIYSTSQPGESLVIVRFLVGEDLEESIVRLNQKLQANTDRIPPGVTPPLIKPRTIDDVPVLALTFHGGGADALTLRRLVAEVGDSVRQVEDVAETTLIGGELRTFRVLVDPAKLASRGMTLAGMVPVLQQANRQRRSGAIVTGGEEILVESGGFIHSARELSDIVLGAQEGRPVYLRDVARVVDGAGDPAHYVLSGRGAAVGGPGNEEAAVTLAVAKRPGANAITVADHVLEKVDSLRDYLIPADIEVTVTRNYGETAAEKSDELLLHMGIAVLGVAVLILIMLGWRESVVVAVAIPSTLALTLLVFYLSGFTLNRITLFALIFSIGILVDDAIVVVENIARHQGLPENAGKSAVRRAIAAVSEVGNPTVLATWAVIAAILPMAFVGGLMGPYMRPIPVGATAAMLFSLLIAFIVTPWAAIRLLKHRHEVAEDAGRESALTRGYRMFMGFLLGKRRRMAVFMGVIVLLLAGSMALVVIGFVKVKMLPFDNKSEFQVVLNMPEGTPLERTAEVARELAGIAAAEPEVTDYQVYVGTAAPFNFNGLVRHYFLRSGSNVADIQINLLPKAERDAQSHEVAKRVRPALAKVAEKYGARIAVAEVPPGPPVLQTLVAEVYGRDRDQREALAGTVRDIFRRTPGVVDVDWYGEENQQRVLFRIDKEKAALAGISAETISETLRIATGGTDVDLAHVPDEKDPVSVRLELPRGERSDFRKLLALRVRAGDANQLPERSSSAETPLIPLGELVTPEETVIDKAIYHKNLLPVTYITGDVAGAAESPAYAVFAMNREIAKLDRADYGGSSGKIRIHNLSLPTLDIEPSIKWDGEWHITLEVFRDLGIAFAAALVVMYMLMVGWFKSFATPLIVMAAIPFSLIGVLPAHGVMGAFFTATSMIGFMAGGGIVVRNSIILVDFIELRRSEGMALFDAVIDAGAVRFRPMVLTAMAVVVGAAVILADPIFQGLAIALMAGEIASLLVSRMAVPVLYYWMEARHDRVAGPRPIPPAGDREASGPSRLTE